MTAVARTIPSQIRMCWPTCGTRRPGPARRVRDRGWPGSTIGRIVRRSRGGESVLIADGCRATPSCNPGGSAVRPAVSERGGRWADERQGGALRVGRVGRLPGERRTTTARQASPAGCAGWLGRWRLERLALARLGGQGRFERQGRQWRLERVELARFGRR